MVDSSLLAGGVLHFASRKLLLWKLIREKNCRGISLISQELFLVMYICRYLDLLYLYVSFSNTIVKVLHLCIALAIVMLMRYSPQVASTYDADLDTFPRSVLIIPCFVLAILYHKVALVMEICRTASAYLEALVLIPQFVLMYKRQAYETWVLVFVVLAGGEHVVASIMSFLHWSDAMRTDPYYAVSAGVQAVVFLVGLLLLLLQKVKLRSTAGLNEAEKPAFDEVWEASKFSFDDTEAQKQAAAAGQQGGGGAAGNANSK